jgi:hypothetical protein
MLEYAYASHCPNTFTYVTTEKQYMQAVYASIYGHTSNTSWTSQRRKFIYQTAMINMNLQKLTHIASVKAPIILHLDILHESPGFQPVDFEL